MSRKSIAKETFYRMLLVTMVLSTFWILPQRTVVTLAQTSSVQYSVTISPTYVQEGFDTNIIVSILQGTPNYSYDLYLKVAIPDGTSHYYSVIVRTDILGDGSNNTNFRSVFTGANTNLVGTYELNLFDEKSDLAAVSYFTVGLTDKQEYVHSESVNIHGFGYSATEEVLVDLKFGNTSISGFPRSVYASAEGVVTDSWTIPSNALIGIYTLTLFNATTTVKSISDVQSFKVGVKCEVQTKNLANQPLAEAVVEVYERASGSFIAYQETNEAGWSRFILTTSNYTFKAIWRNVEVGVINQAVTKDVVFAFTVKLSNIKITVKDEASALLPFIDLKVKYNYTDRFNSTFAETQSFTTNFTGSGQILNVFANIDYIIEIRRYGLLFNTTFIRNLSGGWNDITIIVPTYTMLVQVLDSKNASANGLTVKAYEWSSGITVPAQQLLTDINGNAAFSLTFGRYRVRVYDDTTFLDEVAVNLTQNPTSLIIHSDVYNIDLNVRVTDYFGQPIPNVSVELQRKINSDYETTYTATTGSNGVAEFTNIIGGDSRVYASVAGRPSEMQYLYLVGSTREIMFKLGYVAFAGFTLDIGQFTTIVILIVIIVALIVALTYKKLPRLLHLRRKRMNRKKVYYTRHIKL